MGMASQIMIGLAIFTYTGVKIDKYYLRKPIATVTLPLLFFIALLYKLIKDTSKK